MRPLQNVDLGGANVDAPVPFVYGPTWSVDWLTCRASPAGHRRGVSNRGAHQ